MHCIVCRNSGHHIDSSFVHDFLLHQIQAVFGAASVRLTRHHRHNVRGRYFCFDAIKKEAGPQILFAGRGTISADTPPSATISTMSERKTKAQGD
jgi:hypothetical protein